MKSQSITPIPIKAILTKLYMVSKALLIKEYFGTYSTILNCFVIK